MLERDQPLRHVQRHEGSTKSYKFMQENDEPLTRFGFCGQLDEIDVDYNSGEL